MRRRAFDSAFRSVLLACCVAGAVAHVGCNAVLGIRELEVDSRESSGQVQPIERGKVDKIDLLIVTDDSVSMAPMQDVLAAFIPDLVGRLTNPPCVDPESREFVKSIAFGETCPEGSEREFPPLFDMHVGVITSSLGGFGSDTCEPESGIDYHPNQNRQGRLQSSGVATYLDKGFLQWDPGGRYNPPGDTDTGSFVNRVGEVVQGIGTQGCGFSAPLEAWYRFLVDAAPNTGYEPAPCSDEDTGMKCVQPEGVDHTVLAQREDFLRQDSLLVVMMLSEGLDCSVDPTRGGHVVLKQKDPGGAFHLAPGTSACADDPTSPDCMSCWEVEPGSDPACSTAFNEQTDPLNLRCWDQKRRFGRSFLHPIRRYVDGLTEATLGDGSLNPVFCTPSARGTDPARCSRRLRSASDVVLMGIVGVPWQRLARDPSDISEGYRPTEQLSWTKEDFEKNGEVPPDSVDSSTTVWDLILGPTDPLSFEPDLNRGPLDPHMVQSVEPREGLLQFDASKPMELDPIHGWEREISQKNSLQYACIAQRPVPQACEEVVDCSCADQYLNENNPICWGEAGFETKLHAIGAFPSQRHLAVLKGMGAQGVVASICWADVTDENSPGYGYRPVLETLVDRMRGPLQGQCAGEKLTPDEAGRVPCSIYEVTSAEYDASGNAVCPACWSPRREADDTARATVLGAISGPVSGAACVCEIQQVPADRGLLASCVSEREPHPDVGGWCYVDPTANVTASKDLVGFCPADKKRLFRFVGEDVPAEGSLLFLRCGT